MSIIKDIVQETDIERTRAELMTVKEQLIKLNRQYAWWPTLLHGIINGFGTAIGAGLLVALAAFIFWTFNRSAHFWWHL